MSELPVSQARERFAEVLEQARREPVYLTRHGRRLAVVVDAEEYDQMVAVLEDAEDQRLVDESLAEDGEPVPWEAIRSDLGL